MSFAETREVAHVGRSAERPVEVVVVIAHARGHAASREPALHVSGLEEPRPVFVAPVTVYGEHRARDRMLQDPVPPGRPGGEWAGGGGVDRALAPDARPAVVLAGAGESGDEKGR